MTRILVATLRAFFVKLWLDTHSSKETQGPNSSMGAEPCGGGAEEVANLCIFGACKLSDSL